MLLTGPHRGTAHPETQVGAHEDIIRLRKGFHSIVNLKAIEWGALCTWGAATRRIGTSSSNASRIRLTIRVLCSHY